MLRINGTDDGGSTYLQLLEPLHAESPIAKFLEKNGEGVHHVAFGPLTWSPRRPPSPRPAYARSTRSRGTERSARRSTS